MAELNLTPSSVLKESIKKFIVEAYGLSYADRNGYLEEWSKTMTDKALLSSCADELNKATESTKHSLLSCSNESSSSFIKNNLENADSDIEILDVEESNTICVKDTDQNDSDSELKEESKFANVQIDIEKASEESEVLNDNVSIDLRDRIRDSNDTYSQEMPTNITPSKSQSLLNLNTCLIKEGKEGQLQQNEQLKDSFISNNGKPNQNMFQTFTDTVNAAVLGLASVTKAETNDHSASSHNKTNDHDWEKKNAKCIDIVGKQKEEVLPNKKEISVQNDISTLATTIPSIPIAHGFKRNRSYTSVEHLLYLHELALSKLAELKVPSDSDSCIAPSTPEASFIENKATRNFLKQETCQDIETATFSLSAAAEDTHYKNDCQSSSAESWSNQGRRNSSLSECHGMIAPKLLTKSADEKNISVCSGYDISKMRPYVAHSVSKSNDSEPISSLPSPPQLPPLPPPPQLLPSSSSSLSVSSSFNIAHSVPPKHLNTTDGQEWIMQLPENRKSMESLWPAYRPIYQPYTVYDSRFMQQRVQLSQRPVMIAQPQSSLNPCLEQSHGCVNQYGSRFWGIYSPVAHRIFPRQTSHTAQQQRISTANSEVPHFIPHPTQRITNNHPVYLPQLPKMSPYASHSVESKCKSLEEIVGRIKENNKQ